MSEQTWPGVLSQLIAQKDLRRDVTDWAMSQIMAGKASEAQVAAFAVLLHAKGETVEELAGITERMLAETTRLDAPELQPAVDIVGTGGDGSNSVNISTMSSVVVAATGVPVIKHGSRAASSTCGSADLLEELGVSLEVDPLSVVEVVRDVGIGFCFAKSFHPGMRHAAGARTELGVRTVFNLLGPLTNPAQPPAGLIGCADLRKSGILAELFARRGASVLVVRGEDGLDEISTSMATRVWVTANGRVTDTVIDAADFGFARCEAGALRGAEAAYNAAVARDTFAGKEGAVRDAVLINSGAALASLEGLKPEVDLHDDEQLFASIRAGVERARAAIDSGAATKLLQRWIETSQRLG
ncbi:anthranilate phosphoribosyltransferase [Natronoglycomyces albus]|uniref:Anthranilate phosphoribosyltransferase n=1 Tax=Natronoglycomyces albus TaxID=2811108 RepID=A0A895XSU6_9ACTN|nr:anthranilate phosphoribosyltransferase [Natronoglycomyces albus]QSB06573.1 anthranilate phosphoribosyltransferase [Natronoglycomyces albus]